MHAYHRMEADQTDSIAVCATKKEWRQILVDLAHIEFTDAGDRLAIALMNLGVED